MRLDLRLTGYMRSAYLPLSLFIIKLRRSGIAVTDRTLKSLLAKNL